MERFATNRSPVRVLLRRIKWSGHVQGSCSETLRRAKLSNLVGLVRVPLASV